MKKSVVITGIGIISPLGIGIENNWNALENGRSGISEITLFDASLIPLKAAGEVKDFYAEDYIVNRKSIKLMSRCSQMAVASAGMAIKDSGIDLDSIAAHRVGLYMGLGMASGNLEEITPMLISSFDDEGKFSLKKFGSQGLSSLNPMLSFKVLNNFPLCHTAIAYNIQGPNLTFSSFAPSSAQAVGEAFRAVQLGIIDTAFAGGTDSQISIPSFVTLSQMDLLADNNREPEKLICPFDVDRTGLVPGEGASFIILEELERALARKAHIYAEIIGYGQATIPKSGYSYTNKTDGHKLAMQRALRDANVQPHDIGYINTSADSHPIGDLAEAKAITEVFSEFAKKIPVSSTKSMTGNLLAGSEPFEIAVCAGVLEKGIIPPTLNFKKAEPEVDLNIITSKAYKNSVDIAMSNSFGFCGSYVSLIVKRF